MLNIVLKTLNFTCRKIITSVTKPRRPYLILFRFLLLNISIIVIRNNLIWFNIMQAIYVAISKDLPVEWKRKTAHSVGLYTIAQYSYDIQQNFKFTIPIDCIHPCSAHYITNNICGVLISIYRPQFVQIKTVCKKHT